MRLLWASVSCLLASTAAFPLQTRFDARPPTSGDASACPGYNVSSVRETETGWHMQLTLAGQPCRAFGVDDYRLDVQVDYEDRHRLRVHIFDSERKHVAFPDRIMPVPGIRGIRPSQSSLQLHYDMSPFAFWVTRRSTGETLIDTRASSLPEAAGARPLVFEDQYLQLASRLPYGANIYGLGEVAATSGFRRDENATRQAFWAHDRAVPVDTNLYGAHPVYLEHRPETGSHVVFLRSTHPLDIVLEPGLIEYRALGGNLDFYVIDGPTPKAAIEHYVQLIGLPQMQQRWTLGFHMCRWGYKTVQDMRDIVRKMKEARIPQDTQWVDIDYMRGYADFYLDERGFPADEFSAFLRELTDDGKHFVPIVDLGIAIEPKNDAYESGMAADAFIKHYDGSPYFGKVWPGFTAFPDFFAPGTDGWWLDAFRNFTSILNISGVWADMNEAASFVHGGADPFLAARATWDDPRLGGEADRLNHPPYKIATENADLTKNAIFPSVLHANGLHEYDLHNVFGLTECQSTNKALRELRPNQRPFILSRSTFPSSGTVAAHWGGDNWSTWEQLRLSIQLVFQFGLYGVPLVGADVCGFVNDSEEELCGRWMQLGALTYPFMRNHNIDTAKPQEPFVWDSVAEVSRRALRIRYALMPYLYTLLEEAARKGRPISRALFWEWPSDASLLANDHQVAVGPAIVVTPVLDQGATSVTGVLPGGDDEVWYDYYTQRRVSSGISTFEAPREVIPIHLRGGHTILTHDEPALTTRDSEKGPYALLVSLDRHDRARGTAYFDDGVSLEGANHTTLFTVAAGCLSIESAGAWHVTSRLTHIIVLGAHPSSVTDGSVWTYDEERARMEATGLDLDLNARTQQSCWA